MEHRAQPKEKEPLTTKRAFSMLPNYTGKVEEYDTWRFQMIQFLSEDAYFGKFLEWIENDLDAEDLHETAVNEKNLLHKERISDVIADHSSPPTTEENNEEKEARAKYPIWAGTTSSSTRCWL